MTEKPKFLAYKSSTTNNVVGSTTFEGVDNFYDFVCDTEVFDVGSGYDNTTGVFTAPEDGYYVLGMTVYSSDSANNDPIQFTTRIVSSTGYTCYSRTAQYKNSHNGLQWECYVMWQMTAGDTATPGFGIARSSGSYNANCYGSATEIITKFYGYMI